MAVCYRHFKGKYYQEVGVALDTTSDTTVVVYRTLYASEYALFTRPYDEFHGTVDLPDGTRVPRFEPVGTEALPQAAAAMLVHHIDLAE